MKKHIFSDRRFLNKDTFHSTASIAATIARNEWKSEEDRKRYCPYESEFRLSNCDRAISLSMDVHSSQSLENSIYKITQIEKTIKEYKKALISIRKDMKKWEEENDKFLKEEDAKDTDIRR